MAKLLKKLQIQEEGGDPDIDAVKVATPKDSQSLKVHYHLFHLFNYYSERLG